MTKHISFEYYSTIAPISCAFLTDDPHQSPTELQYEIFASDGSDNTYNAYPYKNDCAYKILQ